MQARSLELAQKSSDQYNTPSMVKATSIDDKPSDLHIITSNRTCFFCGGSCHNRQFCPAKDAVCHNCQKPGHFAKVCQSKRKKSSSNETLASTHPALASVVATSKSPESRQETIIDAYVDNKHVNALLDTGSSNSFICNRFVQRFNLNSSPTQSSVCMVESTITVMVLGKFTVDVQMDDTNK